MLGWFKKKIAKKDRQEEPVVEKAAEAVEPLETIEAAIDVAEPIETIEAEEVVEAGGIEPVQEPDGLEGTGLEPPAESAGKSVAVAEAGRTQHHSAEESTVEESVVEKEVEALEVVEAEPVEEEPDEPVQSEPESVAAVEFAPAEDSVAVLEADAVQPLAEEPSVEKPPREEPRPDKPQVVQQKPQLPSMFRRLQDRLGKTRNSFIHRLDTLFLGKKKIDQELLDDLEEILITADLGVATTQELLDTARISVKRNELSDPLALKGVLRDKILAFLQESDQPAELVMPESGPFVIMVVGVNGVGKTTSIGKIAAKFVGAGQSVLLVAGDTFRAAAIDQLKIWGDRIGVEVVAGAPGSDPSSVVFDGVAQGVAGDFDVIIIDTAGRLHTSVNLMQELKKIKRVIGKKLEGAPHEVMLVLDATTGQNAISQAKLFNDVVGVTGLTLTKLDGTAKGGIVANVCRELKIPVRFIGIGEQADDLRDFDPQEFVEALFQATGNRNQNEKSIDN